MMATSGYEEHGEMTDNMANVESDDKLLAKVAAGLQEATGEEVDDVEVEGKEHEQESTESTSEGSEDTSTTEKVTKDETRETVSTNAGDDVEIPSSYVRAVLKSGWKQEDIDAFVKDHPDHALATFGNLHAAQCNISNQFANLGRAMQALESKAGGQTPSGTPSEPATKPLVDVEALKREYGDNDPLIKGAVEPLVKILSELQSKTQQAPAATPNPQSYGQPMQSESEAATAREIDGFFAADVIHKEFGELYGTSNTPGGLTLDQLEQRNSVIGLADQIMAGARAQGLRPSITEVMEQAHWSVSRDFVEKAVTSRIKAAATKRSKGISLGVSKASGSVADPGKKPANEGELVARVQERMNAIGL